MLCGGEHLTRQVFGMGTVEMAWVANGCLIFGQGTFCKTYATPIPSLFRDFSSGVKTHFDGDGHLEVVSASGS